MVFGIPQLRAKRGKNGRRAAAQAAADADGARVVDAVAETTASALEPKAKRRKVVVKRKARTGLRVSKDGVMPDLADFGAAVAALGGADMGAGAPTPGAGIEGGDHVGEDAQGDPALNDSDPDCTPCLSGPLARAMFADLQSGISAGTRTRGAAGQTDAVLDKLADMLFGVHMSLLLEAATADMPTPRHMLHVPPTTSDSTGAGAPLALSVLEGTTNLTPMVAERVFASAPKGAVMVVNAPKHVHAEMVQVFDEGADGNDTTAAMGLLDLRSGCARAATHVVLVKGTGNERVALPRYSGRHAVVFLLDGTCEVGVEADVTPTTPGPASTKTTKKSTRRARDAAGAPAGVDMLTSGGDTTYLPTLPHRGLVLKSEEGCALVVLSWDLETVSGAVAAANHDVSAVESALTAWRGFPQGQASLLLALGDDFAARLREVAGVEAHAAAGGGIPSPGAAAAAAAPPVHPLVSTAYRAPLLPGTLHPYMRPFDFYTIAARQLAPRQVSLADLQLGRRIRGACGGAADDTDVMLFQEHGVGWVAPFGSTGGKSDASAAGNMAAAAAYKKALDACKTRVLKGAAATARTDGLEALGELDGQAYFPVHYRKNRQDVGQDLDDGPAQGVLQHVLPHIAPLLQDLLGRDARLVEFSCLVSYPGAMGQPPHSDSTSRALRDTGCAHLISCFIPLVDVSEELGPLEVWPRTHSAVQLLPGSLGYLGAHGEDDGRSGCPTRFREFISEEEELAAATDAGGAATSPPTAARLRYNSVRMLLPAGNVVLMDSRCYHRGSANTSLTTPRPVLYFTFASERGALPDGSTYSLLPKLKGRRLSDLLSNAASAPPLLPNKLVWSPASSETTALLARFFKDGCPRAVLAKAVVGRSRTSYATASGCDDAAAGAGGGDVYEQIVGAQEACVAVANSAASADATAAAATTAVAWLAREAQRVRAEDLTTRATATRFPFAITARGGLLPVANAAAAGQALDAGCAVVDSTHPDLRDALAAMHLPATHRGDVTATVYLLHADSATPRIPVAKDTHTVVLAFTGPCTVDVATYECAGELGGAAWTAPVPPATSRVPCGFAACPVDPALLPRPFAPCPHRDVVGTATVVASTGATGAAALQARGLTLPASPADAAVVVRGGGGGPDDLDAVSVVVVLQSSAGEAYPSVAPKALAARVPLPLARHAPRDTCKLDASPVPTHGNAGGSVGSDGPMVLMLEGGAGRATVDEAPQQRKKTMKRKGAPAGGGGSERHPRYCLHEFTDVVRLEGVGAGNIVGLPRIASNISESDVAHLTRGVLHAPHLYRATLHAPDPVAHRAFLIAPADAAAVRVCAALADTARDAVHTFDEPATATAARVLAAHGVLRVA